MTAEPLPQTTAHRDAASFVPDPYRRTPGAHRFAALLLGLVLVTQAGCPTTPDSDSASGDETREPPDTPESDDTDGVDDGDTTSAPELEADPDTDVAVCPLGCDDGNPCTDDRCGELGCVFVPNVMGCDDGDPCTSNDRCAGGLCVGLALDCDDDNACTTDACRAGVCEHTPHLGPCDDEDACTVGDTCLEGVCTGQPRECPATACEVASCSPRTGCAVAPREGACDDGNACTRDDACLEGRCRGELTRCDDTNPCTDDYCDPVDGCVHRPNARPCDDGERCTGPDVCGAGICQAGPALGCCQSAADCPTPDACHIAECQDGACITTPRCADDDPCTLDECDNGECQYRPWAQEFDAGQALLDDFEGTLDHWHFSSDNPEVGWSSSATWSASGTMSLHLGNPVSGTYDHGRVSATATRETLIPPGDVALTLMVYTDLGDDGSCLYDVLEVALISRATGEREVVGRVCASGLGLHRFPLSLAPGRHELELRFDTRDGLANAGAGVFVDDLLLEVAPTCR